MSDEKPMGQVIQIDEARIRDHLGEMVRGTVEETLNAMLDAEADQLCGAGRYERSEARQDTRAGSYERTLQTSAGEVSLKVPKLRRQTFETAIIERYRRRESSVEEALIEMYLAGISVRPTPDAAFPIARLAVSGGAWTREQWPAFAVREQAVRVPADSLLRAPYLPPHIRNR
jgi:putative transposase